MIQLRFRQVQLPFRTVRLLPRPYFWRVEIPAKVDYAVRAMAELARADTGRPVRAEDLADAQAIPEFFLKSILRELRLAALVTAHRGVDGGYRLARPAKEITVADVVRAVHGPLATVRGRRPEELSYEGAASHLTEVWVVLRAGMRGVLELVTIADIVKGTLPKRLATMSRQPDAWRSGRSRSTG
jgi:Rrf2 family protein